MATDTSLSAPLIVITGPTASGKTSLAIKLAQRYGGEIICADSRTVYRGMDIGTAKPSAEEQKQVAHWGLDLVDPGEYFSASDFKNYACTKIADIRSRGKVPFLVGGTGLYIDALIFDFQFGQKADPQQRLDLEQHTVRELQEYCKKNCIKLPENNYNKRYLVRTIERFKEQLERLDQPIANTYVVGIATEKNTLRTRIVFRSEQMFLNSVVKEATELAALHGWDSEAMTGNIYSLAKEYSEGLIDIQEYRRKFEISDWHLVKRQLTWLRRNPYVMWGDLETAEQYLSARLNNRL